MLKLDKVLIGLYEYLADFIINAIDSPSSIVLDLGLERLDKIFGLIRFNTLGLDILAYSVD